MHAVTAAAADQALDVAAAPLPPPTAAAACVADMLGYSPMYGNRPSQVDGISDLSATGFAPGSITGFNLFYKEPCLTGIQSMYGNSPRAPWLLGFTKGSTQLKIPLDGSEAITQVDVQYDERLVASSCNIAVAYTDLV
jgi:hypothetical protein